MSDPDLKRGSARQQSESHKQNIKAKNNDLQEEEDDEEKPGRIRNIENNDIVDFNTSREKVEDRLFKLHHERQVFENRFRIL